MPRDGPALCPFPPWDSETGLGEGALRVSSESSVNLNVKLRQFPSHNASVHVAA
jgi:hypothetical protein